MENYLNFFSGYIMGLIQILAGFHYYTKFLKKECHLTSYLLFMVLGAAVITWIPDDRGLYPFLMYVLMLAVCGFLVCRAGLVTSVLYAVVTGGIMQLGYGIFDSVLCMLHPFLFSISRGIAGMAIMISGNMAIFVVTFCYRRLYPYLACGEAADNCDGIKGGQYAVLIMMPTLLVFLVSEYISFSVYGNVVSIDGRGNVTNGNHSQMLVVQLMGLASLFCVMAAYKRLMENVRASTELSLLRQQEHFLNQYVEEARAHYESTRSFRHDIRNHITVVKELLQGGRDSQALEYIGDMEEIVTGMSFPCSTGNPVVDILIGNKLGIAQKKDIHVSCSLTLPYSCPVRDIDICIILSNALDNAICACKNVDKDTGKYIHITGKLQGDLLLIEIENSFSGEDVYEEGIGLSNMRKAAEKYQGAVNLKIGRQAAVLSVLLIIS